MREKSRKEIPVMHCFDNNYVIPAAVSFYSMLENADPTCFYRLFVLHSDITVQNQEKLRHLVERFGNAEIEFINMLHRFDDVWDAMQNTDHLSKEVLYKLVAPVIFPQYDKLIITDVDVVFLGDIAPSIESIQPDSDFYFAGVRQINPDKSFLRPYYNGYKTVFSEEEYHQIKMCGGYLVANLKKQREDGIAEAFISYLENNGNRLMQAEQDVLNFCCRDKQITYLPLNYVVCSYMYDICKTPDICASDPFYTYVEMKDAMQNPVQLHYATKTKPWNAPHSTKAEIWFDYLKKTGFQGDYEAINAHKETDPEPKYETEDVQNCPVKTSVLVCSYNHEALIRQALESVLNQKTDYAYEVIVADDASTDGTQDIIREYMGKYPEKMRKSILRTENVGIGRNYYEALTKVEGQYLAICDGDDCWLDEQKLQKQIDFLEEHKEYAVICADFVIHNVGEDAEKDRKFGIEQYLKKTVGLKERYTARDLVYGRFIGSCTVMMRWNLYGHVPEFLKSYCVIDFPLTLIHANYGYIKVCRDVLSKYNVHPKSVSNKSHGAVVDDSMMIVREVNQFLGYSINGLASEYFAIVKASARTHQMPKAKQEAPEVENAAAIVQTAIEERSLVPSRAKEIYKQWIPEFLQRCIKLLRKGIKSCYKAIIPLKLRDIVSPFIHGNKR